MNFILDTDSYKLSHYLGYPADAQHIYSYAESRGGKYKSTVFAGSQRFVKDLADTRITMDDINEAQEFAEAHGEPFNRDGWLLIYHMYDGRIPVHIKAVPEGTVMPTHNVLMTVENTDPTMPWLTSYIESALLRSIWYPTTVATRIHEMKKKIKPYFKRTSESGDTGFALLDFSLRGTTSREAAEIGGMGHLMSFIGSDNIPAVLAARKYYDEPMAAFSVRATEHSVMTGFGKENELASFEYLIENMMPENGILSVVCDTWDVYRAAHMWSSLAERVRNKNGTLVFRPDSGRMEQVLPQILNTLRYGFGETRNSKGFNVLNNVKVLWGDGINEDTVIKPFEIAEYTGISADSIMTGSGGGIMQNEIDRDTLRFAFKASNLMTAKGDFPIAKDPITDTGKRSKAGRLLLRLKDGEYSTINKPAADIGTGRIIEDQMQTIYLNGDTMNMETLSKIRARLEKYV